MFIHSIKLNANNARERYLYKYMCKYKYVNISQILSHTHTYTGVIGSNVLG